MNATGLHHCPSPGCLVFPYETAEDLAAHVASGEHVLDGSWQRRIWPTGEGAGLCSIDRPGNGGGAPGTGRSNNPGPPSYSKVGDVWCVRVARGQGTVGDTVTVVMKSGEEKQETLGEIAQEDGRWTWHRKAAPATKTVETVQGVAEVPVRTNRYDGPCGKCGRTVKAGEGSLDRVNGRWVTEHVGACPEAPAAAPQPSELPDVPAGHYAIASQGDNDLFFVRVDRPTEGRWAGRTFVKMIVGGHPDSKVAANRVPGILARIAEAGIEDARALYGREIGRCAMCNRHLTDETSRLLGIGPECRKKL